MSERKTSVDRRAKARVDLRGERVDMLLPPRIVFGRIHVSWKLWGCCLCEGEHGRKESERGRMGDGVFFLVLFSVFFFTLF